MELNIGDVVCVGNMDGIFTTYKKWADTYNAERYKEKKYPNGRRFEVKVIAPHLRLNDTLCLLSNEDGDFIFSVTQSEIEVIRKATKPRTRAEYEKVTESAAHVIDEFENGGKFYYMAPSLTKPALANRDGVFNKLRDGDTLYRLVEKEIDERQEFVDLAIAKIDHTNSDDPSYYAGWFEQLYDAGCRFQD